MKRLTKEISSLSIMGIAIFSLILIQSYSQTQTLNQMRENSKQFSQCKSFLNYLQDGERYVLYDVVENKIVAEKTTLKGVYSPRTNIYCVFNDTLSNNTGIELHEYCHYLIDEQKCYNSNLTEITCRKHFCVDN